MNTAPGVILLVCDNDADCALCAGLLTQQGHTVVMAREAAALAGPPDRPVDLLLLDVELAPAALERRAGQPALRLAPAIVLASPAQQAQAAACLALGADDCLGWPADPALLAARVAAWLELRRHRDQQQAAGAANSDFAALVLHELKAPVTSIRGYTDLLAMGMAGPVNDTQREFLATMRADVDRMMVLISDLTDVARIESGRLSLQPGALDVAEAIGAAAQRAAQDFRARRQSIDLQIAPGLPCVWADRTRLAQILTNLVSNACKYTPPDGRITVSARLTDGPGDPAVQITVQDTGYGIPSEDQAQIFRKFFRSKADHMRDTLGAGLGLTITKHLVELQGGRIWFESTYQRGTAFHFTLPLARE